LPSSKAETLVRRSADIATFEGLLGNREEFRHRPTSIDYSETGPVAEIIHSDGKYVFVRVFPYLCHIDEPLPVWNTSAEAGIGGLAELVARGRFSLKSTCPGQAFAVRRLACDPHGRFVARALQYLRTLVLCYSNEATIYRAKSEQRPHPWRPVRLSRTRCVKPASRRTISPCGSALVIRSA